MYESEDDTNERKELLGILKTAVSNLSEEYREVFILREYDGLSYAEIAKVTNEKLPTVKVRIHRAKQKIREALEPYFDELKKFE